MRKQLFQKEFLELMERYGFKKILFSALNEDGSGACLCQIPENSAEALSMLMLLFMQVPEVFALLDNAKTIHTLQAFADYSEGKREGKEGGILKDFAVEGKFKN